MKGIVGISMADSECLLFIVDDRHAVLFKVYEKLPHYPLASDDKSLSEGWGFSQSDKMP